ncbi:MAG: hypothetical protein K8T25_06950 [Planctomycetia bacterium]|nr:hypothetical protein [Planctomycetia bacterium]
MSSIFKFLRSFAASLLEEAFSWVAALVMAIGGVLIVAMTFPNLWIGVPLVIVFETVAIIVSMKIARRFRAPRDDSAKTDRKD